mmetsp:Transcript_32474/g.56150  ORF Transcript_32474/g.56150 Transcript_32474/m.56150 type:complete len:101 (-) Transcript_32474:386-688(-)
MYAHDNCAKLNLTTLEWHILELKLPCLIAQYASFKDSQGKVGLILHDTQYTFDVSTEKLIERECYGYSIFSEGGESILEGGILYCAYKNGPPLHFPVNLL